MGHCAARCFSLLGILKGKHDVWVFLFAFAGRFGKLGLISFFAESNAAETYAMAKKDSLAKIKKKINL